MARLARAEVFDPSEVAMVHVMARVVRRCFLLGTDPVTGKNHDHRKIWIEDQLSHVAGKPKDVYEMRTLISKRRFYMKRLKPVPAEIV